MTNERCHRFVPARVEGAQDVSEVAIFADRLELLSQGKHVVHQFADMHPGKMHVAVNRWIDRVFWFLTPKWRYGKGEREFCREDRYFRFFTRPYITIYLPVESPELAMLRFQEIGEIMSEGGFWTDDLS